jgi:hypothetical protein
MLKRLAGLALAGGLILGGAAPVLADAGWVDRIENVDTVLAVRFEDDFPVASLMRAKCDWTQFVRRPDGSGIETLRCELSDEPVMIPDFQGETPAAAFVHSGGACLWTSDYWLAVDGSIVMASAFDYVVTPSGQVWITARYPAEPLACE